MYMLPMELIIEIYKKSDHQTRIKLNKVYNLNFYFINPFFDYTHPTKPTREPPFYNYNIFRLLANQGGYLYNN